MRKFLGLLLAMLLACGSALAADEYKIDPNHSSVNFTVTHMTLSTVHGRFTDFAGKIVYDEKDPSQSSVSVTIKTASITTDVEARDKHLKSPDFFDAANFPEITFQSKSVEKTGNGFVAHGTLTIRGVSKDVDLPFELKGPVAGQRGKLLAANAVLTINRQDYGVAWNRPFNNGVVVSNDVRIELNVEAGQPAPPAAVPASK
ncbi:MAG TPA: YceI family protein [Candidatus Angelobacter sp.]|nr:YceI family protein [Candidatus Angelobacter sp.]